MRIVYDFLSWAGLRTSKTVWAMTPDAPCGIPPLPPSILRGITLEDSRYLDYCATLHERGFEICLHGASAGNNRRERTLAGLETIERRFGRAGTYICHAKNAENPYWHEKVAPRGPARWLLAPLSRYRCSGEDPASPYFWGDLCLERVRHIRLFRTRSVNTLAANPSMPYHDPEKPWVASWFSATKRSFADATRAGELDRLVRGRGLCVLYQYMHRYADLATGRVRPELRFAAERLMETRGVWVETTSRIMDRLRQVQGVLVAHRERERWIANLGAEEIVDLQLAIGGDAEAGPLEPGLERNGDVLRVARLPAGRLLRIPLHDPPPPPARGIPVDARGQGEARFRFGTAWVNAGSDPWAFGNGAPLAPGTCRLERAAGHGPALPLSIPEPGELYRLLRGQLAIIGREVLFKGRSLDSRRFLGAPDIALEDHSRW